MKPLESPNYFPPARRAAHLDHEARRQVAGDRDLHGHETRAGVGLEARGDVTRNRAWINTPPHFFAEGPSGRREQRRAVSSGSGSLHHSTLHRESAYSTVFGEKFEHSGDGAEGEDFMRLMLSRGSHIDVVSDSERQWGVPS